MIPSCSGLRGIKYRRIAGGTACEKAGQGRVTAPAGLLITSGYGTATRKHADLLRYQRRP